MIRTAARRVRREGRPVVFYVHPREVDQDHPRLPMPAYRRWKSYVNLHTTARKVERLIADFPLTTFRDLLGAGEDGATRVR
jgi:hypothetical protein